MSQLNFPPNPSVGGVYTEGSLNYIFTGTKWKLFSKKYSYKGAAPANVSNATQIDLSSGNFFNVALSSATTISFVNPPESGFSKKFQIKLSILSNYASTISVTWPGSVAWETGSAPTLPALGQTDVLEFFTSNGGTTYYGKLKEDNVS
jgi:hypothetical protein